MPPPQDPPPGTEGFPWRGYHACPSALSSGHAFWLLLFFHDAQSCSELGSQSDCGQMVLIVQGRMPTSGIAGFEEQAGVCFLLII